MTHIKVELLKGPVVGLGYVLPGSRDVCLRSEQSTKPDMQRLYHRNKKLKHVGKCNHLVPLL